MRLFGFCLGTLREVTGERGTVAEANAAKDEKGLTWNPQKSATNTTVPLKRYYMGFHVGLGECRV